MAEGLIVEPFIQWGFAGFAFLLLAVVVWLIKQVLHVLAENTRAMVRHAEISVEVKGAMRGVTESMDRHNEVVADLRTELIKRPCLQDKR